MVSAAAYTVAGNLITPKVKIPVGKTLRADYVTLGLQTQTATLMASMDDLDTALFSQHVALYQQAITWIEQNFRASE